MVVVDTNILACLLITGDRTRDAQALFAREADRKSEGLVLVELSNVLVTYLRSGALNRTQVHTLLAEAEKHMRGLVSVPHARALRVAEQLAVSAYDARFLAVAQNLGTRLVTEDARLRAAAPALTLSLADTLAT